MNEPPCPRCEGCGKLANDEDQTPWSAWENLPLKSCNGTGELIA